MHEDTVKPPRSFLINRNIVVNNHRTSVRLEAEMWSDLRNICRREDKSIHEICSLIRDRKNPHQSLTSAIRVFLIAYYRSAATEDGHIKAGHGQSYQLVNRSASVGDNLLPSGSLPAVKPFAEKTDVHSHAERERYVTIRSIR